MYANDHKLKYLARRSVCSRQPSHYSNVLASIATSYMSWTVYLYRLHRYDYVRASVYGLCCCLYHIRTCLCAQLIDCEGTQQLSFRNHKHTTNDVCIVDRYWRAYLQLNAPKRCPLRSAVPLIIIAFTHPKRDI